MNKEKSNITVSVGMVTYNHEKYIAQAIEGALMQKTNFDFELVIGEDCSTDNTLKIIEKYKQKYPNKIRLITSKKNIGMHANFVRTLKACRGKYIALCEGDDYWTDPYKLQKQVDFLEANPDYVASGHETKTIFANGNIYKKQFYLNNTNKNTLTINDFLVKIPFHTSSLVFNNHSLKVNIINNKHLFRDYPLMIYAASKGKIKMFHEVMSVYRKHSGGVSENINTQAIFDANILSIQELQKNIPKFTCKANYMRSHWYRYYLVNNKNLLLKTKVLLFFKSAVWSFCIFPKNLKKIISLFYHTFIK